MFGLTLEQHKLVTDVHDNYEKEFKLWSEENESYLMKWYDENEGEGIFTTACKFAYYCANEFMKERCKTEEA